MISKGIFALGAGIVLLATHVSAQNAPAVAWRSTLYPADWKPGFADVSGRFLHDFSYAGYHRGDQPIPDRRDNIIDVTKAPYLADSTGAQDATTAIQTAINTAGQATGGGVVFLPAGIYKISPPGNNDVALKIQSDHVVLRGAGVGKTFIYNDSIQMHAKRMIELKSGDAWLAGPSHSTPITPVEAPSVLLTQDLPRPAKVIPVADTTPFAIGDLVVIRNELTQHYIDLLSMTGTWTPIIDSPNRTLAYYRRIVSIDAAAKTITIDIPTRGFLYLADKARVAKFPGHLVAESGLEDFSIGMKEHPGKDLDDDEKKNSTQGTTAYDVTNSAAIIVAYAENCWVRRVSTYCPPGNDPDVHLLSMGIILLRTKGVTVQDCEMRFPQYKGGGGNGYGYAINGGDSLLRNCRAEGCRHNFSFGTMQASGDVLLDCEAKNGRLHDDFHMFLSLANLIDNMTLDGDTFDAVYRPFGGNPIHGVTTTQSVFWNANGLHYPDATKPAIYAGKTYAPAKQVSIISKQFGDGYVIGTRGPANKVETTNFLEGEGTGDQLVPHSLYVDQFQKRTGKAP